MKRGGTKRRQEWHEDGSPRNLAPESLSLFFIGEGGRLEGMTASLRDDDGTVYTNEIRTEAKAGSGNGSFRNSKGVRAFALALLRLLLSQIRNALEETKEALVLQAEIGDPKGAASVLQNVIYNRGRADWLAELLRLDMKGENGTRPDKADHQRAAAMIQAWFRSTNAGRTCGQPLQIFARTERLAHGQVRVFWRKDSAEEIEKADAARLRSIEGELARLLG